MAGPNRHRRTAASPNPSPTKGSGFIETTDGLPVRFHRNAVADGGFGNRGQPPRPGGKAPGQRGVMATFSTPSR
ncbi:hypothetical protein [Azospirillum agricola]|uniref:hypothetical protein n=1 Tax=Azospirillum agricola TaxID=1720247 RepID=UPI000A0F1114|nr:hypothetical protein [Azospirillum agricola]SMH46073.1 hypothetical protein SAMN02982994_2337 [Azospirillum lipoferum]